MNHIYAKHLPYNNSKLNGVIEEMKELGSPTIKVVNYKNEYFAIEGSHRLAACNFLNKSLNIIVVEENNSSEVDAFWDKVKERLPKYYFKEILIWKNN